MAEQTGVNKAYDYTDYDNLVTLTNGSRCKIPDSNFLTPDMGDYYINNMSQKQLANVQKGLDPTKSNDGLDAFYYTEQPYSLTPGYYPEAGVFMFKAIPAVGPTDANIKVKDNEWMKPLTDGFISSANSDPNDNILTQYEIIKNISYQAQQLNMYDGNQMCFFTDNLLDGGAHFTIAGQTYGSLKEFLVKDQVNVSSSGLFGIKFAGINAPSLSHKIMVTKNDCVKNNDKSLAVYKFTIKDVKNNPDNFVYDKVKWSKESPDKTICFIKLIKNKKYANGGILTKDLKTYYEVTVNADYFTNHDIFPIIFESNVSTNKITETEAIEIKREIESMFSKAKDWIAMVDMTFINKSKDILTNLYGYDFLNSPINLEYLQDMWSMLFGSDIQTSYINFNGFGVTNTGKLLGTIYIKLPADNSTEEHWVNMSKWLIAKFNKIKIVEDNTISSEFKMWTYNKTSIRIVDSLDTLSLNDYDDRQEVQRTITGKNLDQLKDYTVMIGDCCFMIPPTSIRVITQSTAEKLPLLRARGSAIKSSTKTDRSLEFTLFFNDESGINGVPYTTTANGELDGLPITYYMNGLRSLISAFKLTPFLPIENKLINEVLNIDAVVLTNMKIGTVENYPKCITVTLTLQEFDYRVYMPELPTPDPDKNEDFNKNMFSSCICYKTMRWFYQQPLIKGEEIKEYKFTEQKFIDQTFGNKNALIPMKFNNSNLSFYIPNEDQLKQKLALKIKAQQEDLSSEPTLTNLGKTYQNDIGKILYSIMNIEKSPTVEELNANAFWQYTEDPLLKIKLIWQYINGTKYDENNKFYYNVGLLDSNNKSTLVYNKTAEKSNSSNNYGIESTKLKQINLQDNSVYANGTEMIQSFAALRDAYLQVLSSKSNGIVDKVTFIETTDDSNSSATFTFKIHLNHGALTSTTEWKNFIAYLKDGPAKIAGADVTDFINNSIISITYKASFQNSNNGKIKTKFALQTDTKIFDVLRRCAGVADISSINEASALDTEWENANTVSLDDILSELKNDTYVDTSTSMQFNEYPIGSFKVNNISCSFGNTFARTSLQAQDGYAPQYMGGQDTTVEISLTTKDETTVSMLNNLPKLSAHYARTYRKVLASWPLRMESELTKLLGVYEVLIEYVDINTVPGQPGLYNVNLRLTSVDRTVRNKEALKQIETENDSGKDNINGSLGTKSYFDLKDSLAKVELYPDLELPKIDDLSKAGFQFIRYSKSKAIYPDPDFYFVYSHIILSEVLRDSIIYNLFDQTEQITQLTPYTLKSVEYSTIPNGTETPIQTFDIMINDFVSTDGKTNKAFKNFINQNIYICDSYNAKYMLKILKVVPSSADKKQLVYTIAQPADAKAVKTIKENPQWFKLYSPLDKIPSMEMTDQYGASITITPQVNEAIMDITQWNETAEASAKTIRANLNSENGINAAINKTQYGSDNLKSTTSVTKDQNLTDGETILKIFSGTGMYNAWNISNKIRSVVRESNFRSGMNATQNKDNSTVKKISVEDATLIKQINAILNKPLSLLDGSKKSYDLINADTIIKMDSEYTRSQFFNYVLTIIPGMADDSQSPKLQDLIEIVLYANKSMDKTAKPSSQIDMINNGLIKFISDVLPNDQNHEVFSKLTHGLDPKNSKDVDNIKLKEGLKYLLFGAACANSSPEEYNDDNKSNGWRPRLFSGDFSNPPLMHTTGSEMFFEDKYIPLCQVRKDKIGEQPAISYEEAIQYGVKFGPYQIKKYTPNEIRTLFDDGEHSITIPGNGSSTGTYFIDDYYRNLQDTDEQMILYKSGIMLSTIVAAEAYWRVMLVWIRKMIYDGVWGSLETQSIDQATVGLNDVLAAQMDYTVFFTPKGTVEFGGSKSTEDVIIAYYDQKNGTTNAEEISLSDSKVKEYIDEFNNNSSRAIVSNKGTTDVRSESLERVPYSTLMIHVPALSDGNKTAMKGYKKQLDQLKVPVCYGNWFMPLFLAASDSEQMYQMLKQENYDGLNAYTASVMQPSSNVFNDVKMSATLRKMILGLVATKFIKGTGELDKKISAVGDTMSNYVEEEIYIEAAQNPIAYMMHSFYDMVMNDKRGRMCRAFPSFYMMFIDEGREIGLWKLHDNFYNVSAISEIQISKSRKIAADTAQITMSNMFNNYTTSEATTKITDQVYNLKDAYNSIFSPRIYYLQEEARREKQTVSDTVTLRPGIRLHLRMGYGSDASTLPIVFNGCIAEVGVNDIVSIVAQGDGVELMNPILTVLDADQVQGADDILQNNIVMHWFQKGATPRNILTSLLTTRGGVLQSFIYSITQGRFFNRNPYGIAHFGDPQFKEIFPSGEVSQNIYEASGSAPTFGTEDHKDKRLDDQNKETSTQLSKDYAMSTTPKLSSHLYGKSYWDIMSLCVGVSPDYVASVIPFGVRSSIFYGLPHYYAAYDYEKKDGNIVEKRKPFQQYHTYNSYTDILQNNIKASEKDVKTCAVGVYTWTSAGSHENTKRVGPLWVDFEIYPEKQKTMTVDTMLLSKGCVAGNVIPFVNHFLDKTADLGGEELAWRITATALRDAVKEMYVGELIVLGDPTVKPYDRIYIDDIYESMNGACDVEAVVHNFSVQSGFITSVYVDAIAAIDDNHVKVSHGLFAGVMGKTSAIYTTIILKNYLFNRNFRPFMTTMTKYLRKGLKTTDNAAQAVLKLIGKEDWEKMPKFLGKDSKLLVNLGINSGSISQLEFVDYIKKIGAEFEAIDFKKLVTGTPEEIADAISTMGKVKKSGNQEEVIKDLEAMLDRMNGKGSGKKVKATTAQIAKVENSIKELQAFDANITKLKNIELDKDLITNLITKGGKELEYIKNGEHFIDDAMDAKKILFNVEKAEDLAKIIRTADTMADVTSDIAKITETIETAASAVKSIKAGGAVLSVGEELALGAAVGPEGLIITAIAMILEYVCVDVIAKMVYSGIERMMRSYEVLQIYPLKQNGVVLTAGLDGSKGLVIGSPTENDPGALRGLLADTLSYKTGDWSWIHNFLMGALATDNMREIAANYRKKNNLPDPNDPGDMVAITDKINTLLSAISSDNMISSNAYQATLLKPRITVLTGTEAEKIKTNNMILCEDIATGVPSVSKIGACVELENDMIYLSKNGALQQYITNKYLIVDHDAIQTAAKTIDINLPNYGASTPVHYKSYMGLDKNKKPAITVYDVPFLRPDAYYVLIALLEKAETLINVNKTVDGIDYFTQYPVTLTNALRIGDPNWWSTGYAFRLKFKNADDVVKLNDSIIQTMIKDVLQEQQTLLQKKNLSINHSKDSLNGIFQWKQHDKESMVYDIIVCPPKS